MPANAPIPSLSDSNWVYDNKGKVDFLMSYFYESLYSQTQLYYPHVSSMSYLLYKYGNNPSDFSREVESTLQTMLSRYVDSAKVSCSPNLTDSFISSINMYVEFTDSMGNIVTLSDMLNVENNKITKVVNAVNGKS